MCGGRQETWDCSFPTSSALLLLLKEMGAMTQTPHLRSYFPPWDTLYSVSQEKGSVSSPSDGMERMRCTLLPPPGPLGAGV